MQRVGYLAGPGGDNRRAGALSLSFQNPQWAEHGRRDQKVQVNDNRLTR